MQIAYERSTFRFFFVPTLLLCLGITFSMSSSALAQQKVLFDTDMAWDWDDVGAMAVLHALADMGEAEILGMGISTRGGAAEWNPKILDIINTYYKRPNIPIGMPRHGITANDNYGKWLVEQGFPFELDRTWDAVDLYRKLLAESPDKSVVLISVGYLNNMDDLLRSGPDKYSELNGEDLITQKVQFLSAMAGGYPGELAEANMQDWKGGYAEHSVANFPVPILFTSSQTGDVGTGASLLKTPKSNPIRAIYEYRQAQIHPKTIKHPSFDPIAVYVAIRDVEDLFDLTPSGNNVVWRDQEKRTWNRWEASPDHGHRYFTHKDQKKTVAEINALMGMLPAADKSSDQGTP